MLAGKNRTQKAAGAAATASRRVGGRGERFSLPLAAEAVTNGEEQIETTKVSTAPIWLVVQVQDGFATRVRVYQREPEWG